MKIYQTKSNKLPGTRYADVYKNAFAQYKKIKRKTKRRPYIRSAYFKKDKIFLELFWQHLHQKNWRDRVRRVRYFACAIELIKNTRFDPESKEHPKNSSQILHRFTGITPNGDAFRVQVREDKKTGQKWLISTFPVSTEKLK